MSKTITMKITFLGSNGVVTGSRHLVEHENTKILVDCGLFQGRHIAKRNWDPFPVDPRTINAIVLTHAHLDHTGYIPVLIKNGFKGTIYCSKATAALSAIVLRDSGNLQEEYAYLINKHESRHKNQDQNNTHEIKPLYTIEDAEKSLQYFHPIDYNSPINIGPLTVNLIFSSHILGSAFVEVSGGNQKLTFSGDLGQQHQLLMKAPPYIKQTDYLVLESTYGDRVHDKSDIFKELAQVISSTFKKNGVLVIPSFAVERTQTLLYCLYMLKKNKSIPDLPIYLDSPMAIEVTNLFCKFKEEHLLEQSLCQDLTSTAKYIRTVEESKEIDNLTHPAIIIAGSGMADGGRVVYHIKKFVSDPKNTILFVGYQAEGTLGNALISGEKKIRIYGVPHIVKAQIKKLSMLSAHADYNDILQWLSGFEQKPKKIFLTHGEPASAESLKEKIEQRFGFTVIIPKYEDYFDLD